MAARKRSKAKRAARKSSSERGPTAVPPGFRNLTPSIAVVGGRRAIEFYQRAFGAKSRIEGETPDGKILHATLRIGDSAFFLSDIFPGSQVGAPPSGQVGPVSLHVYTPNVDKFWERAVAAGANIMMPLDDMFWGERYGQLSDPFGNRWSISMRIRMSPKERKEKERLTMAMFDTGEPPGSSGEGGSLPSA